MESKNIHVLPTDKPSNGCIIGKCIKELSDVKIGQFTKTYYLMFDKEYFQPHNIYITSDEEIKEGVNQWYLDKVLNEPYNSGGAQYSSKQDVIILTTDPDLIKDGVQAIDDDFLEWFVNNPSCESVELEKWTDYKFENDKEVVFFNHKIIIPKEEVLLQSSIDGEPIWGEAPKPMHEQIIEHCGGEEKFKEISGLKPKQECCQDTSGFYLGTTCPKCNRPFRNVIQEPKQETLEEAAERYSIEQYPLSSFEGNQWNNQRHNCKLDFIAGSEQQEQKTIEEVFEWLTSQDYLTDLKETLIENFEQFKNKEDGKRIYTL